jgi:LysR family transcriptional regulator, glycine cleavage system transcriptional activator
MPVASPAYMASVQRDAVIDWPKVTFLRVSSLENDWNAWIEGIGLRLDIGEDLYFDTVALAMEAAICGIGIAIGRLPLVTAELHAGRLVKVDARVVDIETGYWLVGPDGQETRPAIRAFRKWLLEESQRYRAESGLS